MHSASSSSSKLKRQYDLVSPDGGWGYVVVLSVALIFITGALPLTLFGVVFGQFLASIANEISATAFINTINNAVIFFSGLPASYLLQKYTHRKVALAGALCYFTGAFLSTLSTGVFHLILTFGVFQGLGFGLLLPSGLTAFNEYFNRKRNMMLSICHTIVGSVGMFLPYIISYLVQEYGFRGTAAILAAFSLHLVYAALTFQPIKWHYKKLKVEEWVVVEAVMLMKSKKSNIVSHQIDAEAVKVIGHSENFDIGDMDAVSENTNSKISDATSNECRVKNKEENTLWKSIVENLDLSLFNDSDYVCLSFGTSMARASEAIFLGLIPALLVANGFERSEITSILTTFFAADLAGKVFLSILNGLFRIWNRYVFLIGALFSAIFQIAFTMNLSFLWTINVAAALGFLRSFIQITFPLVFAEKYGPRFKTAFSLNMALCGFTTLLIGGLAGGVEHITGNYNIVVYFLAIAYLLCAIPWLAELFLYRSS
ncbi:hypothetical protein Trydic_g9763 [Trypoxylus dichotomus]